MDSPVGFEHSGEEQVSDDHADDVKMFFFARFHARPGNERAVEEALLDVLAPSLDEPGCLGIHAFRSIHDPGSSTFILLEG